MPIWLFPFLTSLAVSLAVVPLVRRASRTIEAAVRPATEDRKHPEAVLFGGVAITLTVTGCSLAFNGLESQTGVLAAGLLVSLTGLTDEVIGLRPTTKVAVQVGLAAALLFLLYRLELTSSVTFDSLLTLLWVVGVTNAVNRLDRTDGLCAGVALTVTAGILIRLNWPAAGSGTTIDALAIRHSAVLLGAVAGFLVFNLRSASVQMGDSGGLFIGINLAALALTPGVSPLGISSSSGSRLVLLPIVLAPVLSVLLVPVLDTGLFTVWSARYGRPTAGAVDRMPHRLFGIRPSRALALAVLWSLGAATAAVVILTQATMQTSGAGAAAAVAIVAMTFAVVLTGAGVYGDPEPSRTQRRITPWPVEPFHRYRAAEVVVDACLVLVAYYAAYRIRYPDPQFFGMFTFFRSSLPFVLAAQTIAFFAAGMYSGRWPLFGLTSVITYVKGVVLGVVSTQLCLLYLYRAETYPRSPFVVYTVVLFLLLTGSRASFRAGSWYLRHRARHRAGVSSDAQMTLEHEAKHRVVRVITRLNIGGPAIQASSLSHRLAPLGYDTLLLYGRLSPGEGDMGYLLSPEVSAEAVPTLGRSLEPIEDARAFWRIYRALCRFQPVIVHTHTAKAGAVGRLAAIAYNETLGRLKPSRLVHTYHGHVFDGYFGSASTSVFIVIERWLARHTDALVAISPLVSADLVDTYRIAHPEQIRVVPLGFDLSQFAAIDDQARARARLILDIPHGRPVVTTVGRLTEIKQHDLFLKMAAAVARTRPDVEFLIVGDGELRDDLERLANELGIEASVRFLGWRSDLATIYGATDVFVLTSRNEGTPVALIEAMASGVASVSTDVGGVRDVVRGPETGAVVPFGSPEGLSVEVLNLLAASERRRVMGSRAREDVICRFAIERLLGDIVALYDELLKTTPPGGRQARNATLRAGGADNAGDEGQSSQSLWSSFTGISLRPRAQRLLATLSTGYWRPWRRHLRQVREKPAGLVLVASLCAMWLVVLAYSLDGSSDSNLQRAVHASLAVDSVTSPLPLEVTVARGVIRLEGETTTRDEQQRAVARVRAASGTKRILDHLRLSDATIARSVAAALAADPVIGRLAIEVTSRRGVVSLSSDSTNAEERKRAVAVAERVDGVRAVDDQMR